MSERTTDSSKNYTGEREYPKKRGKQNGHDIF